METTVYTSLEITGEQAKYDANARLLLSDKQILPVFPNRLNVVCKAINNHTLRCEYARNIVPLISLDVFLCMEPHLIDDVLYFILLHIASFEVAYIIAFLAVSCKGG